MAAFISYSRSFPSLLLFFVASISTAAGGFLGVDYGRMMDNPMPPKDVVKLLQDNGFGAAAIYDADAGVIQAFSNSGIKLRVSLPNDELENAARDADTWVREHVGQYYPATQIDTITVGNEVFHQRPDLNQYLFPAMQNVYNALKNLGLADKIKVSTPFAMDALSESFPPSKGKFRDDLQPIIRQILQFLDSTGSFFMVNIYPFFAYRDQYPKISREYFLGLPNPGMRDDYTGLMYYNLLDAERDAVFYAVEALGFASLQQNNDRRYSSTHPESGCPSCARQNMVPTDETGGASSTLNSSLAEEPGCSIENAQAYNSIVMQRIRSGNTGTPLHPNADMTVYIFSLFNENLKPGSESERSFGLFYPDGRKVYDWDVKPAPSTPPTAPVYSWCVANPTVGQQRMQGALDYACGQPEVDCRSIQPGAACYEPNTVAAHASYAMNSYYQSHGRGAGTCNFNGVGQIVYQRPGPEQLCEEGRSSWCVANPAVGQQRMQAALDWACGQGKADCRPIQPGAACFEPNTVEAHASYAMNSYYQQNRHGVDTCKFDGVGRIVYQRPRFGKCDFPSSKR